MSRTLRPLVPVVVIALLCTALLHAWIRTQPLAMPPTTQVALSALLVVVTATVLTLGHRVERDHRGIEDR